MKSDPDRHAHPTQEEIDLHHLHRLRAFRRQTHIPQLSRPHLAHAAAGRVVVVDEELDGAEESSIRGRAAGMELTAAMYTVPSGRRRNTPGSPNRSGSGSLTPFADEQAPLAHRFDALPETDGEVFQVPVGDAALRPAGVIAATAITEETPTAPKSSRVRSSWAR